MLTKIPHGKVEIGRNTALDTLSQNVDFIVYGEFADAEELALYKSHSTYQHCIDVVRPLRDLRIAADFLSP